MSDYIIVRAHHILIPKATAQARLGVMCTPLVSPSGDYGILSFRDSVVTSKLYKVWRFRNAIQTFCAGTPLPRYVGFVGPLADRLLKQSNWLRYHSA